MKIDYDKLVEDLHTATTSGKRGWSRGTRSLELCIEHELPDSSMRLLDAFSSTLRGGLVGLSVRYRVRATRMDEHYDTYVEAYERFALILAVASSNEVLAPPRVVKAIYQPQGILSRLFEAARESANSEALEDLLAMYGVEEE